MLSLIMLNVVMLNVIMLNVVMLRVMAPRILALFAVKNKMFYKNHTWAQCYKTFYDRNLRISLKL